MFNAFRAGVGTIGLVDPDVVDRSNLHRQFLHRDADAAQHTSKVDSAARFVAALNPTVAVIPHCCALDSNNALALVSSCDVVADCSDNPMTRYLLSDACVLAGKALVSGSAVGLEGQVTVYNHAGGPCYRYTRESKHLPKYIA
jgi:adenylyltransferase/sulfurtransferase